jgi:hypothetical protein
MATLPPDNGTDKKEIVSNGGGPPGVHVRRQHGQEDTQRMSKLSNNREALGMELEDG